MSKTPFNLALVTLAAGMLSACGGGAPQETTPAAAPTTAPAADTHATPAPAAGGDTAAAATAYEVAPVTDGGKVEGKVKVSAAAPEPESIEVTKDVEACGKEKKMENVKASADGGLQNAVVWIENIAKGKDWAAKDGTVDQKDCHYVPHMQGLAAGANLEIVNSDPVLHNIHAYKDGETLFNIAQPTKDTKTPKKMTHTGPIELKCDVHSWMHAWVFVAPHPYYAVTKDDGTFEIGDVPAGTYKVKVWHESLGSKDAEVTVAATQAAKADFTLDLK